MRRSGRKCQPSVKVSSEDFVTEQNGMDNTAKPSKKRGIKAVETPAKVVENVEQRNRLESVEDNLPKVVISPIKAFPDKQDENSSESPGVADQPNFPSSSETKPDPKAVLSLKRGSARPKKASKRETGEEEKNENSGARPTITSKRGRASRTNSAGSTKTEESKEDVAKPGPSKPNAPETRTDDPSYKNENTAEISEDQELEPLKRGSKSRSNSAGSSKQAESKAENANPGTSKGRGRQVKATATASENEDNKEKETSVELPKRGRRNRSNSTESTKQIEFKGENAKLGPSKNNARKTKAEESSHQTENPDEKSELEPLKRGKKSRSASSESTKQADYAEVNAKPGPSKRMARKSKTEESSNQTDNFNEKSELEPLKRGKNSRTPLSAESTKQADSTADNANPGTSKGLVSKRASKSIVPKADKSLEPEPLKKGVKGQPNPSEALNQEQSVKAVQEGPKVRGGRRVLGVKTEASETSAPAQTKRGSRRNTVVGAKAEETNCASSNSEATADNPEIGTKEENANDPKATGGKRASKRGTRSAETVAANPKPLEPQTSAQAEAGPGGPGNKRSRRTTPAATAEKEAVEEATVQTKRTSKRGGGAKVKTEPPELKEEKAEEVQTEASTSKRSGPSRGSNKRGLSSLVVKDEATESPAKKRKVSRAAVSDVEDDDASAGKSTDRKSRLKDKKSLLDKVVKRESSGGSGSRDSPTRAGWIGKGKKKPTIMFTGYEDKVDVKAVREMGGLIAAADRLEEADVLVTDKIRRTAKLMCAMARGMPVVGPSWIAQSKMTKTFLDPWQYIIKDEESEKKWRFSLANSLAAAGKKPLLKGLTIHATKSCAPPPEMLKQMVEASSGRWTNTLPTSSPDQQVIVLSCDKDKATYNKALKKGVKVYQTELLLLGLLRQDLDFESHQIMK